MREEKMKGRWPRLAGDVSGMIVCLIGTETSQCPQVPEEALR